MSATVLAGVLCFGTLAGCSASVAPGSASTTSGSTAPATAPVFTHIGEIRTTLVGLGFLCAEAEPGEDHPSGPADRVTCSDVAGEPVAGDVYLQAEFGWSADGIEAMKGALGVEETGALYDGTQVVHSQGLATSAGWTIMVIPGVSYAGPDDAEKVNTDAALLRSTASRIQAVTGGAVYPG